MDNEILKLETGGDDGGLFISGIEKLRSEYDTKLMKMDAAIGETINGVRWDVWNVGVKASQNIAKEAEKREVLELIIRDQQEAIWLLYKKMRKMSDMIHYGMMSIAVIVVGCAVCVWSLS